MELHVTDGLHNGVSLPLTDGDYLIGSSTEADIVLHDEGVAPRHAMICVEANHFRVEAIGSPLNIGNQLIELGQGCRLRLPVALTIGSASLQLTRPGEPLEQVPRSSLSGSFTGAPAILAAVVLACLAMFIVWENMPSSSAQNPAPQAAVTTRPEPSATAVAQNASTDANAAAERLKEQLSAARIRTFTLAVENRLIRITGSLPQAKASAWTDIQRWFDSTYAPDLALSANITMRTSSSEPIIRLRAIWYGDRPYIIAENGNRYYEGAHIEDGWLVHKIDEERITLTKGDEQFSLTYE